MSPEYNLDAAAIRFWAKVDQSPHPAGCWVWTARRDAGGYGLFETPMGTRSAHRFSFILATASTPLPGFHVCHHCDNPACIRPDHLYIGTAKENADDFARRGRSPYRPPGSRYKRLYPDRRERQWSHPPRLADAVQREIRAKRFSGIPCRVLAKEYDVPVSVIYRVTHRPAGEYLWEPYAPDANQ